MVAACTCENDTSNPAVSQPVDPDSVKEGENDGEEDWAALAEGGGTIPADEIEEISDGIEVQVSDEEDDDEAAMEML